MAIEQQDVPNVYAGGAPVLLSDARTDAIERMSSGIGELDRVLGKSGARSGFVPGSVVLLAAEPGAGIEKPPDSRAIDPCTCTFGPLESCAHVLTLEEHSYRLIAGNGWDNFSTTEECLVVRTRLGREVALAPWQQLLTIDGWRRVDEIAPGTGIASPRHLAHFGNV